MNGVIEWEKSVLATWLDDNDIWIRVCVYVCERERVIFRERERALQNLHVFTEQISNSHFTFRLVFIFELSVIRMLIIWKNKFVSVEY